MSRARPAAIAAYYWSCARWPCACLVGGAGGQANVASQRRYGFRPALSAALAIAAVGVREARACGGFFCNAPPPDGSLPIAQAAENVLFVLDTDPGDRRASASRRTSRSSTPARRRRSRGSSRSRRCRPSTSAGTSCSTASSRRRGRRSCSHGSVDGKCQGGAKRHRLRRRRGEATAAAAAARRRTAGPTVDVLSRGSVGPYRLRGGALGGRGDAADLADRQRLLRLRRQRASIVDDYVATGHSFVAVRLQVGQDTSAIRPIILRMESPEACLPLKLTAIASTPESAHQRLGAGGGAGDPDQLRRDRRSTWRRSTGSTSGATTTSCCKEAANEAQGNAFAVEYAQPSDRGGRVDDGVRPARGRRSPRKRIRPATWRRSRPPACTPTGAVMQVLRKYIPMPATLAAQGVTEAKFYANIQSYWSSNRAAFAPFDPVALTAELETEVLQPIDTLRPLFERNAYLTRLATFISPEEMTKDPLFVTNAVAARRVAPAHRDRARAVRRRGVLLLRRAGQHRARGRPQRAVRRAAHAAARRAARGHRRDAVGGRSPGTAIRTAKVRSSSITAPPSRRRSPRTTRRSPTPGSGCGCSLRARPRGSSDRGAGGALALLRSPPPPTSRLEQRPGNTERRRDWPVASARGSSVGAICRQSGSETGRPAPRAHRHLFGRDSVEAARAR